MCNTKPSNVGNIMSANNGKMNVEKSGEVSIELSDTSITVDGVLHVPDIAANLLSVYKICQKTILLSLIAMVAQFSTKAAKRFFFANQSTACTR